MDSCAITDHGNLYGAIEFYRAAKKEGIKPILGCEIYTTENADGLENTDKFRDNLHMVVLAKNNEGWKNLVWLVSNANLNNFYYTPRVSWDRLADHSEGLIVTTACLGGITAKSSRWNKDDELVFSGGVYDETGAWFDDPFGSCIGRLRRAKEIFGENLYLEVQKNTAMWEQKAYNGWVRVTSEDEDIPMVITTDCHYLREYDHTVHALINAQKMKMTLESYQEHQEKRFGTGYYLKSPELMHEAALELGVPEAAENTNKIAEQCEVELTLGEYESPHFDVKECDDYEEFLEWNKKTP